MTSGNFKVSYQEELAIFQTLWIKIWMGVLILAVIIFPFSIDRYYVSIVNSSAIAAIGALGLNILVGYTGLVSIGHAAFLALGAYSGAVMSTIFGFPIFVVLPLAGIIAALGGLLIGIPSLRLKGLYIAMATLAFNFIVEFICAHWRFVGADVGMAVDSAKIGSLHIDTEVKFYFMVMIILSITVFGTRNLFRSKIGRSFIAIRDRHLSAELIGINIARYKIIAFGISSFYAGIAGCLFAYYSNYITPENFNVSLSIEYLAMIIMGGLGTIVGALFGAIFITLIPEGIRMVTDVLRDSYPLLAAMFADFRLGTFGLIIVCFLIFEPTGLYGIWKNIKTYFQSWPYKY